MIIHHTLVEMFGQYHFPGGIPHLFIKFYEEQCWQKQDLGPEVEKIFFFLRVWYQSQIFSANFSKFWQGFSLKDSINTIENGIFFNCLLEFSITLEFWLAKDLISWYFPKYFLPYLVFVNIFCELNSQNLPLFPPLAFIQGDKFDPKTSLKGCQAK